MCWFYASNVDCYLRLTSFEMVAAVDLYFWLGFYVTFPFEVSNIVILL